MCASRSWCTGEEGSEERDLWNNARVPSSANRARCAGSAPRSLGVQQRRQTGLRAHTCWATESLVEETPLQRKTAQQLPMRGKRHHRPSARDAAFAPQERAALGVRLHDCRPAPRQPALHLRTAHSLPLATWQAGAESFLRQCDDSLRRRAVRSAPALRVHCRLEPPECTVSAQRALPPLPGDVRAAQKAVAGARGTSMPAQTRQIRVTASPHGPAMSRGCSMSCAGLPSALDECPCSGELPSLAPCTSGEAGSAATTCRRRPTALTLRCGRRPL